MLIASNERDNRMHERPISIRLLHPITVAAFGALSAAAAVYSFADLYRDYPPYNRFAAQLAVPGLDIPAHFFGAGLALLLLMPLQLSIRARRRAQHLHRSGVGLAASGVLIAAVAALSMARHTQSGAATGMALAVLALAWLFCMDKGTRRIVGDDVSAHRHWICRAAALTFAAITLRLLLAAGMALHLQRPPVYVFATWASWSINLAVCEALLRWSAIEPHPSVAATAAQS